MHPAWGKEVDVYLSTEVPIIIEVGGGPKPVAKQVEELLTSVRDTLKAFEPEF
jgi:hypothetical protein